MSFPKQIPFFIICALALSVIITSVVFAAPPGSPYNPGETLQPLCAPGDVNCTITTPAVSGANNDITSLSGLTTALSVSQGGIGLSTIAANKLLYTSALNTLAELNLDSTLSIVAGVLGITDGSITESKLDILDSPADGEILSWNNASSKFEWIVDAVGSIGSSIWDADTDTGIQVEEAADEDTIRFDTAGIERIRIGADGKMYWPATDGGNVVWNPGGGGELGKIGGDEFWHLAEESSFSGIVDTGYIYVNDLHVSGASGQDPAFSASNSTFTSDIARFKDNATTVMVVKDGGNVGIGTSTPTQKLDVNGSINVSTKLYTPELCLNGNCQTSWITGSGAVNMIPKWTSASTLASSEISTAGDATIEGSTGGSLWRLGNGDNWPSLQGINPATSWSVGVADTFTTDALSIKTETNDPLVFGTNNQERLRITASGNVGIGTSDPVDKLSVNGIVRVQQPGSTSKYGQIWSAYEGSLLLQPYGGAGNIYLLPWGSSGDVKINHWSWEDAKTNSGISIHEGPSGLEDRRARLVYDNGDFAIETNYGNIDLEPEGNIVEVNGGIRLNTVTAKPACNSGSRGTFWYTQGAAGVKDNVEVCAKDATNAYAWRTIY